MTWEEYIQYCVDSLSPKKKDEIEKQLQDILISLYPVQLSNQTTINTKKFKNGKDTN